MGNGGKIAEIAHIRPRVEGGREQEKGERRAVEQLNSRAGGEGEYSEFRSLVSAVGGLGSPTKTFGDTGENHHNNHRSISNTHRRLASPFLSASALRLRISPHTYVPA